MRGLKFGFKDSHCVFYQIFDFNLAGDKLEHSHDNSFCNTTITIKKCPWSSSTTAPIQSSLAHNKRIRGTLHQHPHSAHCWLCLELSLMLWYALKEIRQPTADMNSNGAETILPCITDYLSKRFVKFSPCRYIGWWNFLSHCRGISLTGTLRRLFGTDCSPRMSWT